MNPFDPLTDGFTMSVYSFFYHDVDHKYKLDSLYNIYFSSSYPDVIVDNMDMVDTYE